jgi:hypothetical protein
MAKKRRGRAGRTALALPLKNIELCADTYLPIAEKTEEKRLKELDKQIKSILSTLEKQLSAV